MLTILLVSANLLLGNAMDVDLKVTSDSEDDLASTLTFKCSVTEYKDVLASISLHRQSAQGSVRPWEFVAAVSALDPETPFAAVGFQWTGLEGHVDSESDSEPHLEVSMPQFRAEDLGLYVCKVFAIDEDGDMTFTTAEARVAARTNPIFGRYGPFWWRDVVIEEVAQSPGQTTAADSGESMEETTITPEETVEETTVPVTDTTVLVEEATVPVTETTVLVEETTVPVEDTPVLVEETTVPVEDTTVLVEETTVPVADTTVLVEETTVPVADTTVLVEETTVPVADTTVLVEETTVPVADTTVLLEETTIPVAETTVLVEGTTVLLAETTVLVANTTVPVAETTVIVEGTTVLVEGTTVLVEMTTVLVEGTTVLVEGTTVPLAERSVLVAETTVPVAETTVLVEATTVPVAETTVPVAETTVPVAETTVPVAETTVPMENTTGPVEKSSETAKETTPQVEESTLAADETTDEVISYALVHENSVYFFFVSYQAINVSRAQRACEREGLYLAEVNDAGELQAISNMISPYIVPGAVVLVAGKKMVDQDVWLYQGSRNQVDFFAWDPNDPLQPQDKGCLALRKSGTGLTMVSVPCGGDQDSFYFLCEQDG